MSHSSSAGFRVGFRDSFAGLAPNCCGKSQESAISGLGSQSGSHVDHAVHRNVGIRYLMYDRLEPSQMIEVGASQGHT